MARAWVRGLDTAQVITAVTGVALMDGVLGAQTTGARLHGNQTAHGAMDRGRTGGEEALAQDQTGQDGRQDLGVPLRRGRAGRVAQLLRREQMLLLLPSVV